MTAAVQEAVEEIRRAYSDHPVSVEKEEQGGAYVTVGDLSIGSQYQPETSSCRFTITFQYPQADIYPHFLDPGVKRKDHNNHPQGFGGGKWRGNDMLQISRRSNKIDPMVDTAALKLEKVLQFIRQS